MCRQAGLAGSPDGKTGGRGRPRLPFAASRGPGLLLVVLDFGELGVDDVVGGRGRAPGRAAGTALVGDPDTVAERLEEYAQLGVDTVIASGYPHLEEAYRVAELLFPHLDIAQPERPASRGYVSPFGEMISSDILPKAASAS